MFSIRGGKKTARATPKRAGSRKYFVEGLWPVLYRRPNQMITMVSSSFGIYGCSPFSFHAWLLQRGQDHRLLLCPCPFNQANIRNTSPVESRCSLSEICFKIDLSRTSGGSRPSAQASLYVRISSQPLNKGENLHVQSPSPLQTY